jgi:pimeloyl-ACP methyl ester carboxylesterase
MVELITVRTPVLDVACEVSGPADGRVVVLLHGFPYDPRSFDPALPLLHAEGWRCVTPYLRGYGPTRFLAPDTPRAGQQAAIGADLKDLLDALDLKNVVLAGYDWGARAACIVAALWPERVAGLVTCGGYQIQDIAAAIRPADAEQERRFWYQYYLNTERGRLGLEQNRHDLCKLMWHQWSPTWAFDDATYAAAAKSLDNPDFVAVSVHSYRHRLGNAPGFPAYADIEARLATLPAVGVPGIVLHGDADGVTPTGFSEKHARFFTGRYERRVLPGVGHCPPAEAPAAFADAVLALPT